MMFEGIAELKTLSICYDCIGDTYLSKKIEDSGENANCAQCDVTQQSVSYADLADIVDEAFQTHYYRTSSQMDGYEYAMHKDDSIDYQWEQDGDRPENIIADQVGLHEDCALDITKLLAYKHFDMEMAKMGEDTEFSGETQYEAKRVESYGLYSEWREFEEKVKKEERYFSEGAKTYLDSMFGDIETLITRNRDSVIRDINPGEISSTFFRGRIFQSESGVKKAMIRPDMEVGPSPADKAGSGRMNAKGISVFYGATHPEISLAELRPPVGCTVVMAEFKLVRPVRLLDLNLLSEVIAIGSIFDPEFANHEARSHFLSSLVEIMTRPTDPHKADEEYLPTQLIADYIANAHPSKLDGILFSSSQSKEQGFNVVLFRRASKVKPITINPDSDVDTKTYEQCGEDEYERHYSVTEWFQKETETIPMGDTFDNDGIDVVDFMPLNFEDTQYDTRDITLEVNIDNLIVRIVKPSVFDTDDYKVARYKYDKDDLRKAPF